MADVALSIGGYSYTVACRAGDEDHLLRLGAIVDAKANEAKATVGTVSEVRQLLLAALLFADESLDSAPSTANSAPQTDSAPLLALAERLEALAETLESSAQSA